jgi:ADP-L-glycero-D-manno-heptose 6-epimerase
MIDLTQSRVLVTGGAGFIGSALVWALNKCGCDRIVIADFLETSEKWRNLAPLRFEDYLEADTLLHKLSSNALGHFSLILHMGACSSTTEQDAAYLTRNNYEFTKQLATHALATGTRFVYASSAATYGDGSAGMLDTADTVERLSHLRPLNMYGYSKQLFDMYAARQKLFDRITGLKFFNIYGPNEYHKGDMRSLVNKAYTQVLNSGEIALFKSYRPDYADGEQQRDFLYVTDAVSMTLHIATHPDATGLFNIGSGQPNSWIDLATAVFHALDKPPKIRFIEMPETLRPKYQYYTRADITKLSAAAYTTPITPLRTAVTDYIHNYLIPNHHLGDPTPTLLKPAIK